MKKLISAILAAFLLFAFAPSALAAGPITKDQYFARSTLKGNELKYYDVLYNAIQNGHGVDGSDYGISDKRAYKIAQFIYNDAPELLDQSALYSTSQLGAMKIKLDQSVDDILSNKINNSMSDYDKVKTLYCYLASIIQYDNEAQDQINKNKITKVTDNSQSAYGGLVNKKAVCAGISSSFQYLLYKVGILNYVVTGKFFNQNHAWNILQLDGDWYYCDLTSDMSQIKYNMNLSYFMLDDSFKSSHIADEYNPPLPACTSTKYMNIQTASTPEPTPEPTIAPVASATPQPSVVSVNAEQAPQTKPQSATVAQENNYFIILMVIGIIILAGGLSAVFWNLRRMRNKKQIMKHPKGCFYFYVQVLNVYCKME